MTTYYELRQMITPEWPCVLYFDLEFARDEHGEQWVGSEQ